MKFLHLILFTVLAAVCAWPQAAERSRVAGVVSAVDSQAKTVSIKTDKGDTLVFTVADNTQLVRAIAGETDTKKFPKITVSDIAEGDQAVAVYRGAADQKPLIATSLMVRTKADMSQLAQKQMDEWKHRGSAGIVASVDSAAKTIALKAGARSFTVQADDKTKFMRYSPDSAKPADARPSNIDEIKTGDQVNVLGNRSADGSTVAAEQIYSGVFRQIAATINSIDTSAGELKVTDLATKKPLIIRITSDSSMRKLPEQMATMLARRYQANAAGAKGSGPGGPGGPEGGPPRGGRGGRDIGQMLDQLPPLQLSDLKAKDAIMVCTTAGSDPGRVTATNLLAGVEPLLTASPNATRDIMSGWNLGGGGGGEGGQ
jgi:hypothetical protein